MSTPSYKGIIQDGLLYHTDLAQPSCWEVTPAISGTPATYSSVVKPLPTDNKVVTNAIELDNYGLTEIDLGRTDALSATTVVNTRNGLVLSLNGFPVIPPVEPITGATSDKTGNYMLFNGRYLQSFFKLEGYDYELLPDRYAEGVTLETSLLITPETFNTSNNFFLYLGARAENKFYDEFNAVTGKTTTNGLPLGPDHADDPEMGVAGNGIGFLFDKEGRIGYRAIGDDLEIIEEYSLNNITHPGWLNISLAYTPCEVITDPDLLDCAPRRGGTLRVFVNGLIFHEFHGFQEYMFQGMETEKEKQIGVPYTISWGGGTRGLLRSNFYGQTTGTTGSTEVIIKVTMPDLLLRKQYNGRFTGGVQTLRIYNRPLSVLEARENHNALAPRYDLPLVKGGRVTPKINW